MESYVSSLCQSMYTNIRKISFHRKYMTQEVAAQLMVSLVFSKLDYCNCILYGLPQCLIDKLQKVQNCAARVCLKKRKFDNVTPLLRYLHWLPVSKRIDYKIATIVHKCIHGNAPPYIKELIHRVPFRRTLRSASDTTILIKPRKKLITYGERSFEYAGTAVWNTLPKSLRELENITTFKKALKTHLFSIAYQ